MRRILLALAILLLAAAPALAVANGQGVSFNGSSQYLSGTTAATGYATGDGWGVSGVDCSLRFVGLRVSYGSDQTLFEMAGFGRLYVPAGTTKLRFVGRDGSAPEVTLGSMTTGVVRFGSRIGPYVHGNYTHYVYAWDEKFSPGSLLAATTTAADGTTAFDVRSRNFAVGARVGGTEPAQVIIGHLRVSNGGMTEYHNLPSYWPDAGHVTSTILAYYFEGGASPYTGNGGMNVTPTNNGSATFVATANVPPYANAGADQPAAGVGRFLLDGSRSYDVDNSAGTYFYPASWSWSQLTGTTLSIANASAESTFVDNCTAGSTYTFRLTVTDEKGDTATDDVSVTCANPSVSIAASNTTPYVGQAVRITSASGGWADFTQEDGYPAIKIDDGQGYGSASVTYMPETVTAFLTPGTKTVTQTVKNNGGSQSSGNVGVTVSPLPTTFANQCAATTAAQLQTCINNAAAATGNQLITLPANTTITTTSSIQMKKKVDSALIWIRSTGYYSAAFPTLEQRISPTTHASLIATLSSSSIETPTILTEAGQAVANYVFTGINFTSSASQSGGIVLLGRSDEQQTSTTQQPQNIAFHHCLVTGTPTLEVVHGLFVNAKDVAWIGGFIDEIHKTGAESHGVVGLNTEGGLVFWNSYLGGASINFFFGGSQGAMPLVQPKHFAVRRCWVEKHLKWMPHNTSPYFYNSPTWDGTTFNVKNNLEFKTGWYIALDSNVYENCWVYGDQVAYAVNINNTIDSPWANIEWVQITNSRMKNTGTGHTLRGRDEKIYNGQASVLRHMLIRNNLYDPVGDILLTIPSGGYVANFLRGILDLAFIHNTSDETGPASIQFTGEKAYAMKVMNNAQPANTYGYKGDGVNDGNPTFSAYTWGIDFRGNILAGADSGAYPAGGSGGNANHYTGFTWASQFVDYANGNFRLASTSVGKNAATDGTDIGADIDALNTSVGNVTGGDWTGGTGASTVSVRARGKVKLRGKLKARP